MAACLPHGQLSAFSGETHLSTKQSTRSSNLQARVFVCLSNTNFSALSLQITTPTNRRLSFVAPCSNSGFSDSKSVLVEEPTFLDIGSETKVDVGGGGGDGGSFGKGGSGGGGGEGGGDCEDEEFGPIMKFEDVLKETEARGAKLPADMMEAAMTTGLPKVLLSRYLDLQVRSLSKYHIIIS